MAQQYLADSNTIIDYIGNKMPDKAMQVLDEYFNSSLIISVISKIEVLGFNDQEEELTRLSNFIELSQVLYINDEVADKTIELRKMYKIKLPPTCHTFSQFKFKLLIINELHFI